MLRILQITEASSAGVGRHVMDLVAGLKQFGCESHLIFSTRRIDAVFTDRLRASGIANQAVEMRRGPHPSDLRALRAFRKYLRAHGPFDIVHAHSTKAGLLARILPACGAKIVYTPHCIYTMNPLASPAMKTAVGVLEQMLARRSDAIVAVSPVEQQHICSLNVDRKKVHCIINGVDALIGSDKLQAREKLGLPKEGVIIGSLGRLFQQKDPLTFVRAVAPLLTRQTGVFAAVAGTGELEQASRNLAAELGVADRIYWLGFRTAAEVMPAFDLFALSSAYEGMPYTLLEATAAGLPVVTTDVGGASVAVEDAVNGYIVPVGDHRLLSARLQALIENSDLRSKFGYASQLRSTRYSIGHMVWQTYELYRRLLGFTEADQYRQTGPMDLLQTVSKAGHSAEPWEAVDEVPLA